MSDPFGDRPFPKQFLWAASGLVGLALLTTTVATLTGWGKTEFPDTAEVASLSLVFEDRADGAVVVRDAGTGDLIETFDPGTNGFVRGVMRGFARERMMNAVGSEPPFRIVRWADGRVSIEDPQTGRVVDVGAFGPDNAAAFAGLIDHIEPHMAGVSDGGDVETAEADARTPVKSASETAGETRP